MSATQPLRALSARWKSPAKVNLCLRVVGRRADGYHLLDSVFVPVDLCDRIALAADDVGPGRQPMVEIRCKHPGVPEDGSNLVARAAMAVLTEVGVGGRLRLTIDKTIPPGAGLGGGSSNAATVLRGLNDLLEAHLPAARLSAMALALGADVPFFLCGGPARVRGIGEDVLPLAGWPVDLALVVAIPPVMISTSWVFGAFREMRVSPGGDEPGRLAGGAGPRADLLVNDLERVVLPAFPSVARLKERLVEAGADAAVMSGSGSAVVGVASSAAAARRIAATVRRTCPQARVYTAELFRRAAVGRGS